MAFGMYACSPVDSLVAVRTLAQKQVGQAGHRGASCVTRRPSFLFRSGPAHVVDRRLGFFNGSAGKASVCASRLSLVQVSDCQSACTRARERQRDRSVASAQRWPRGSIRVLHAGTQIGEVRRRASNVTAAVSACPRILCALAHEETSRVAPMLRIVPRPTGRQRATACQSPMRQAAVVRLQQATHSGRFAS